MSLDRLDHRLRPASGDPEGALVLLHGRGTSEHDLFPLLDLFDPERRLVGVTPGGPLSLPPGGRHWYAIRQLGYPPPETFLPTYERLCKWLDALPEALGVPAERTILGGFSQGGVMSYAAGLGAGRPGPAGIMALSAFVPTVEGLELDLADRDGFPVAIAHGSRDPVIGVEWGRRARDLLVDAGCDVLYVESEVSHTLDPRGLPRLAEWVQRTVDRAAQAEPPAAAGS
jgi:phospholipase/carboxylesterase